MQKCMPRIHLIAGNSSVEITLTQNRACGSFLLGKEPCTTIPAKARYEGNNARIGQSAAKHRTGEGSTTKCKAQAYGA